ncbi:MULTISPECIES: SDR family oxidoreductase [Chryseobacterium]|uniref:Nucleoside-diphosphate-sugar epimerase n=1 Tax=Chryseobacterium camelliae TaxID=1265445 RepID=A0ABU0TDP1_9FLAO|nr:MULTISPECIES: SDR family oxidoreductase [Chryseobacterium]MDT3407012.1 nucleoside-diphosphate-sugar epimerase [Pseudacidovorax intermedius]MDQ1095197.1 nucleoside-diphosphate-sugar epimerase [Chryseobacterium camelliae]MDQ1099134.1 nucleoside-diphosphate-sugar epimerase [Chryseobacterium sp. SORGH_AS_1048]MDR6086483.1 nucleoside-diphosphate-sugar epimerase [Chryseobacterium sp. SORGH_AS_0909]MDR6130855.1 nucleoside-diphosphate-sugar epimerase [Chryseobacterium sp. SORGH_AS_1175]
MKVFVTGASGYNGSAILKELINAGHQVTGLARSEESARIIRDLGADVFHGNLEDLEILQQGAQNADGIIHCAFNHDFMKGGAGTFLDSAATDRNAIFAMGEVLKGTDKAIVITSGMLGLPKINGFITEESVAEHSPRPSEEAALDLASKGVKASVIRLAPSVHDKGDAGFIPFIISQARKNGVSAYPDEGKNCWVGVHRLDAAKAFRLAVEKGHKGALYNIVDGEGVEMKKIAELIGKELNLPVASLSGEDLNRHFEWMSYFITLDCPATNFKSQEMLGWKPSHIGLLEDMKLNYF